MGSKSVNVTTVSSAIKNSVSPINLPVRPDMAKKVMETRKDNPAITQKNGCAVRNQGIHGLMIDDHPLAVNV